MLFIDRKHDTNCAWTLSNWIVWSYCPIRYLLGWQYLGLDVPLLKQNHDLGQCSKVLQGQLHRHGGLPKPGGEWLSRLPAAKQSWDSILLDWNHQNPQEWNLDLAGQQQHVDRQPVVGRERAQQQPQQRVLCGDLHQSRQTPREVEWWEMLQ